MKKIKAFVAKKIKKMSYNNLEDFGYEFNEGGQLKSLKDGSDFQFVVKEDNHHYNQKNYEALGEVMNKHIYKLLENTCQLTKLSVPDEADDTTPQTFVFASKDFFTNTDKLLVLIHGSGVVRAGQWARRLIINDSLQSGTQIPFIQRGQKEGYAILVMNTNDNFDTNVKGKKVEIKGSETPEKHAYYVWESYIKHCKAKHIYIVAHSYGGCVVTSLFKNEYSDFCKRVVAIALTDSVHYTSNLSEYRKLCKISRNWVASNLPLDTPADRRKGDIPCVSSGADTHEMTSWSSFESIFKYFLDRLKVFVSDVKSSSLESVDSDGQIISNNSSKNGETHVRSTHSISDDSDDDDDNNVDFDDAIYHDSVEYQPSEGSEEIIADQTMDIGEIDEDKEENPFIIDHLSENIDEMDYCGQGMDSETISSEL